jgi:cobalt-zinc-cadmium efflux system membrane fusion protein
MMKYPSYFGAATIVALGCLLSGCNKGRADAAAEAPPPLKVEHVEESGVFQVDHPEQFALAKVGEHEAAPELNATGSVNPDVSRNIPVISIATGRVMEIYARLGDAVTKGELLMRVQSQDIAQAFSDYRKALSTEQLNRLQLDRSQSLFDKGAIAKSNLEQAEETEESSKIDVATAQDHLKVLGADAEHPSSIIDVRAPVSGVITDQQVTAAAGVQGLSGPNPFTISDLSRVWVICDVYENDLPFVRLGQYADIRLTAYPDLILKGRIGNIGPTLDPNLRTAKVRLEVENPGALRLGMFVTATFHGLKKEVHATVPAMAILHLHDRDWVYVPSGGGKFRRVEVHGGDMLPGNMQEVLSGVAPGQQVVANALQFQNSVEQ